ARCQPGAPARAAQLRRVAARSRGATEPPRRPLPRLPLRPVLAGRRLVRVAGAERPRLGRARARRGDRDARPRTRALTPAGPATDEPHRLLPRVGRPLAALPARRVLDPRLRPARRPPRERRA